MIQELNSLNQRFSVPGLNSLFHDVSESCVRSKVCVLQLSHLVLFESKVGYSTLLQFLFFLGQAGHEWLKSKLAEKFSIHCLVLQDGNAEELIGTKTETVTYLMKMLFSFSLHIMALCLVGSEGESCHKLQSSSFS